MEIAIILDNLISNSRKAHANEVAVSVKSAGENYVNVLVQDDGKGIKNEATKNIFDLAYTTTSGFRVRVVSGKKYNGGNEGKHLLRQWY